MYRFITGVVALGLAACAAYFSVIGIASLMGANFLQVAVMAGFLEAGKLVCASAAYRFRKIAPTWVRSLLITFTVVMMIITSLGIFGFLSSSYQEAASERDISQQKVENLESKKQTFEREVERLEEDRSRLITEQQDIQQTRSEQGWLSERQDERLSKVPDELSETDSALTAARDSVLSLETRITELQSKQTEDAKLGPIIFVANTVGIPEDSAALYFILLLIFVFDPMAVTLVVALSMATDVEETVMKENTPEDDEEERVIDDYDPVGKKIDLQKIREELGKPLPDRNEEPQSEPEDEKETGETPDDESQARIDRMHRFAGEGEPLSEETEGEKVFEEKNSQNKPDEQTVEEDPSYPKEQDDDFKQWLSGGKENVDSRDKPWKNAHKEPFN